MLLARLFFCEMSHLHRQLAAAVAIDNGITGNADIEEGVSVEHVAEVADTTRDESVMETDQATDTDNAAGGKDPETKLAKSAGGNPPAGGRDQGLSDADRAELEAFRARKAAADKEQAAEKAKQDAAARKQRWLSDPLAINRQVLTTSLVDTGLDDAQIAEVLRRQPAITNRVDNQAKADAPPADGAP